MMHNKCQPHEMMENLTTSKYQNNATISVLKLTRRIFSSKVGTRKFCGLSMSVTNIAGYKFVLLTELELLCAALSHTCLELQLKGTVLLGREGINLNLAGTARAVIAFKKFLMNDVRFADMSFRESHSEIQPFKFMKVKLRKEIITMRCPEVKPDTQRAPVISPPQLKQWLDEGRDITLLDTRNDYEVRFGTFENASHFQLTDFSEFPAATEKLKSPAPVVMFCTGGIRCEKAALFLQAAGHPEVYQLEGGILNYFSEVGAAYYQGECFVFDQRVSVDAQLQETGTLQCKNCQGPVTREQQALASFSAGISCHACEKQKTA
jgi:UPF0176 protein